MAYVHASLVDVGNLLSSNGYEVTQENIEECLHQVFGFSRQRMGEFGVETEETCLKPEHIGKNRWYSSDTVKHKTRTSGVCYGVRYVGYERKDAIWLSEGNPSEEVKMEIRNDPSYNQELAQLSRRRAIS